MIGSDLVPGLHNWHPRMLLDINYIIYNRMGYEHIFDGSQKHLLPEKYELIDTDKNLIGMISSTEIRKRIKESRAEKTDDECSASYYFKIGGLVSKSTIEYIQDN